MIHGFEKVDGVNLLGISGKVDILSLIDDLNIILKGRALIDLASPDSKGWMVGACPLHDDKNPSFEMNVESGSWICFASCGTGSIGEFIYTLKDINKLTEFPTKASIREFLEKHRIGEDADELRKRLNRGLMESLSYRDESSEVCYKFAKWAYNNRENSNMDIWLYKYDMFYEDNVTLATEYAKRVMIGETDGF